MIQQVYTIRDAKAGVFSQPFLAPNENLAIRNLHATKQQAGTHINLFPADFGLYHLGAYDDESATFELNPQPVFVLSAGDI